MLIAGVAPGDDTVVPDGPETWTVLYPIGVRHTARGPRVTGWRTEDGTVLGTVDDPET